MGYRSQGRVRLIASAVPSIHTAPAAAAAAAGSGGSESAGASVRDSAKRKRELCTVSIVFLTFANFQISQYNDFNNDKQRVFSIYCCKLMLLAC